MSNDTTTIAAMLKRNEFLIIFLYALKNTERYIRDLSKAIARPIIPNVLRKSKNSWANVLLTSAGNSSFLLNRLSRISYAD
jgi:hypothetical protein